MSNIFLTPEQIESSMNSRYSEHIKSQQQKLNAALWTLRDACIITNQEFDALNKRISNAIAGNEDIVV